MPKEDDIEQCVYCLQWFPKPVSLHHSEEECIVPAEKIPTESNEVSL